MILIGVSWEIIELFMALNEGNPTCWLYDITRITASRWPCVFLIHGMLSMILDVLVPIGFCVIFVSRQPTPYLQAAE